MEFTCCDIPEYQAREKELLFGLAEQEAYKQGIKLEVTKKSSLSELMDFLHDNCGLTEDFIAEYSSEYMSGAPFYEQSIKDAEFLTKLSNLAEKFFDLVWQRYQETGNNEFVAVNTAKDGTIECATINMSLQQHNGPDLSKPVTPATLSVDIGGFNTARRLNIACYPKFDENGNLQIKDWGSTITFTGGTKMSVKVRNGYFYVVKNGQEIACFNCFSRLVEYLQVIDYMEAH